MKQLMTLTKIIGGVLTLVAISGVRNHAFGLFFGSYMAIFLLTGIGNGSTYRMIPSIFAALGEGDSDVVLLEGLALH